MRYWTHYWAKNTVARVERTAEGDEDRALEHTAANGFAARGIEPGDVVYVITQRRGVVRVLGRLIVDRLVGMDEAEEVLSFDPWEADDHLLAVPGTVMDLRFDAIVPTEQLDELRFVTRDGERGIFRDRRGAPDRQSFRHVRQITADTAGIFDDVLGVEPTA